MHVSYWKYVYFDWNFIIQHIIIGSGNGLAPNKQQSITWTSDDKFTDAYICDDIILSLYPAAIVSYTPHTVYPGYV